MKKYDDYVQHGETELGRHEESQHIEGAVHRKQGKFFYYDSPLSEDTGVWIPVSVPSKTEREHGEWSRDLYSNVCFLPDGEMCWNSINGENKELTMQDVVSQMLIAARGNARAIASLDVNRFVFPWVSSHLLEQPWKEMAQILTEANFGNIKGILEADPPKWLPDSSASSCMLCNTRFHPIMCSRHHCRFCGEIFCNTCSKERRLLPTKFRAANPQQVCDVCCVRPEAVQASLIDQVVTLKHEKSIPDVILKEAKGLPILTVAKVGVIVTYKVGTGLVVARRQDGSWSPASAISSFGIGWGAQAGGAVTDFIRVLRTESAVRTFSGNFHFSVGAGLSAAAGIVGRVAEAVHAGVGGCAACYT